MKRFGTAITAMLLVLSIGPSTGEAAGQPDYSKMTPAMAELYTAGGYGAFPIDQVAEGYTPGTLYYLVQVAGIIDDSLRSSLRSAGAQVRFEFPEIGWMALVSPVSAVAEISLLPRVVALEIDRVHDIQAIDATIMIGSPYADQSKRGTHDIGAEVLWAQGITGKNVLVGVTDSGIDSTHPDLGYKIKTFADCTIANPEFDGTPLGGCLLTPGYDDNGHGSHVSGIAAGGARGLLPGQLGLLPGVAPDAGLAGAKVCLAAGSCLNSSVMAGLRYVATDKEKGGAGADVVNVSLGSGRFYFAPLFGTEQVTNNDPEAQLVNRLAVENNVVFTISAGNSGPVLQSVGSPSVASQVISVGAAVTDFDLAHPVEQTQHGELGNVRPEAPPAGATGIAQFSSRGPTGDRLIKPELTAPGVYYISAEAALGAEVKASDVAHRHNFSADPVYAVLSGTSMSSPAAAGAAALVWDGYQQATGKAPPYFQVKAALANTAGTHAFEGSVVGLLSGIRAKNLGEDPQEAFPLRNQDWVGVTGEGAGRIYAPSAYLAITKGITAYVPQVGDLDNIHELQPNWALDDVAAGESRAQTFVMHGAPGLAGRVKATFSVEQGREPLGIRAAPASWFKLPKSVTASANLDSPFSLSLNVPLAAAPGSYAATVVANVKLSKTTSQNVRLPVQFFVPAQDADVTEGRGISVEGPIWASELTDYSIIGFEDPLGDIHTDWSTYPIRLPVGTGRLDLSVYDTEGRDHMDIFVFDRDGQEIDSTVTPYLDHVIPGGALYAPTTPADPNRVSILDGDDLGNLVLPTTVWVTISDSGPDQVEFSTYHLDIDQTGGGGGATPAERIHSGSHAWWSGSVGGADSTMTQTIALPSNAATLRFWTWYNLEDGFDWAYALVSTDGGTTWNSLVTTAANGSGTTALDPVGDSGGVVGGNKKYPNGFTGTSGMPPFIGQGLVEPVYTEQAADVSAYAGRSIQLRFGYSSDPATNLENFYVDDVSIVTVGGGVVFTDDTESPGAWVSGGIPGFAWVTAG